MLAVVFLLLAPSARGQELSDADRPAIEALRRYVEDAGRRRQETAWAEKTWPTVRRRLIELYRAEENGQVRVDRAEFIPPGIFGEDLAEGPALNVVKLYEQRLADGTRRRAYVNEHWPVNPRTGGLLPPDAIRAHVQVFSGDLRGLEAGDLFLTAMIGAAWGVNPQGFDGDAKLFPVLYRQHLYAERGGENRLAVALSPPTSCRRCHAVASAAITPDAEFSSAARDQPGYGPYLSFLDDPSRKRIKASVAAALADPKRLRVPHLLEALEKAETLPWLEGDEPVEAGDANPAGSYRRDGVLYRRAPFAAYADGELLGAGTWWKPGDLELIP